MRLILVPAAVAAAVALMGAQPAHAATTCAEGGRVLTVSMTENGDLADLQAGTGGVIAVAGRSGPITCAGTALTTYVDTILINDISDDPATPVGNDGATTVVVHEPASFAPGHTQEPAFPGEIEFLADVKAGHDSLVLDGEKPQFIAVGNGGVNWTNDSDADMIGMPFKHVRVWGSSAADQLSGHGGPGIGAPLSTTTAFEVFGLAGSDILRGSASPRGDRLEGGAGPDELFGEAGDDSIQGDAGDDLLDGGAGADAVRFSTGPVTVDLAQTAEQNTGDGRDVLRGFENVYGSGVADRLIGNGGANALDGGGGDDILDGRGGADELRGGIGLDTVSYANAPAGVTIDLGRADQTTDGDRIYFVESVIGSRFADRLTGSGGGAPQSRVVAGAGSDVVTADGGTAVIDVRDGERDRVICDQPSGPVVVSDRRTLDAVGSRCVRVDALPERPAAPAPDTRLEFTLGGARKQRLLRHKAVRIKVACPSEPCTTVATSAGKLRPRTTRLAAGPARTLKLRLTRRQLATVRRALTTGRRPSLTVRVVARDSAGNTVRRQRRITAVP
jgi:RTX calcium-binding nonapeptide repeat (4 copies)